MREPIDSPAAWKGDELLTRPDWMSNWSDPEIEELLALAQKTPAASEELSSAVAESAESPLVCERLAGIQHNLEHGSGACFVRGMPLDRLSPPQATELFGHLARHIGTPVSQSASGEKVFSVRDEGYQVGDAKARGPNTRKKLSFHTDRCDVIAFCCLKQAQSGGENLLVSSVTLYNEILRRRPDLLSVLQSPFYYARHNVDLGNARPWCLQPIFSLHEGFFAASYLRVLIDRAYAMPELPDMTSEQMEALELLENLAADPQMHVTFRMEPGDMLFLNNWVTFHRRNEFVDHAEPDKRRHLLRIWLAVPNSRPIHPDFAANFGATAAGAIRGGMLPAQDDN